MKPKIIKSNHHESFSVGEYRAHRSGDKWTAYKRKPFRIIGNRFATRVAAGEAIAAEMKDD